MRIDDCAALFKPPCKPPVPGEAELEDFRTVDYVIINALRHDGLARDFSQPEDDLGLPPTGPAELDLTDDDQARRFAATEGRHSGRCRRSRRGRRRRRCRL